MGRPLLTLAAIRPQASEVAPVTLRYVPGAAGAGFTSYVCANSSVVSPKLYPALNAARLACRMLGLPAKRRSIQARVTSVGRPYIHDSRPRANKFLARSASFLVT